MTQQQTGGDVRLTGISKTYGSFAAVKPLDLTVPQGSFFALLGASGCGKTTTLRMIAGLEEATTGTVSLGGRDITGLPRTKGRSTRSSRATRSSRTSTSRRTSPSVCAVAASSR